MEMEDTMSFFTHLFCTGVGIIAGAFLSEHVTGWFAAGCEKAANAGECLEFR